MVKETAKKVLPSKKIIRSFVREVRRGRPVELFHPRHLRSTLQLWVLWFGASFTYFGMMVASEDIILDISDAIRLNTSLPLTQLNTESRCDKMSSRDFTSLVITTMGELVYLPVSLWLTECLGRRKTGFLNLLGCGIFFLLLNAPAPRWLTLLFLFIIRGFGAATFNWIYVYSSEVYPTSLRTIGIVAASVWARVGSVATPFVAQILMSRSMTDALLVYGFVCLACSLTALLLPIETKPQDQQLQEEVEYELKENGNG